VTTSEAFRLASAFVRDDAGTWRRVSFMVTKIQRWNEPRAFFHDLTKHPGTSRGAEHANHKCLALSGGVAPQENLSLRQSVLKNRLRHLRCTNHHILASKKDTQRSEDLSDFKSTEKKMTRPQDHAPEVRVL